MQAFVDEGNIEMTIQEKMIPDEETIPGCPLSIECECDQVLRIAVVAEILHVDARERAGRGRLRVQSRWFKICKSKDLSTQYRSGSVHRWDRDRRAPGPHPSH